MDATSWGVIGVMGLLLLLVLGVWWFGTVEVTMMSRLIRLLTYLGWPSRAYDISSRDIAAHWWAKHRDQEGGQ